ncbi:hypothetical protein PHMEG_00021586 [Phytophthora megakarya]|uniref:Uncharacterized protein n=1 Tax=Phytophthora megakarya TaxID=4795 RepID=A0A225VM61_9STRA|nr:hypothetical protein PHMEG_00021586 [Phytophthora megakarya]
MLGSHFPNVKVILYHFHPKKYIRSMMAETEYGGGTSFNMDPVEDVTDIMRAQLLWMIIRSISSRCIFCWIPLSYASKSSSQLESPFTHVFNKQLGPANGAMGTVWALRRATPRESHERQVMIHYVTVGFMGHIKVILKPEMTLDKCRGTLMFLQASSEME